MNKSPENILQEINVKFDSNFKECLKNNKEDLSRLFLYLRGIAETGEILKSKGQLKHHEKCCLILDEVFSDIVTAIYLASVAIDQPANIVMRRALELGISTIYLWDMPHALYSWESHGLNLSFNEMVTHINSAGYKSYVENEIGSKLEEELIPTKFVGAYYSEFSDIVHGKLTSFESNLSKRFSFCYEDWSKFVSKCEEVSGLLLTCYIKRFQIKVDLLERIPALKQKYGAGV